MSDAPDDWDRVLEGLRAGDPVVLQDFWNRYGGMLHEVAEKHLAGGLRRRVGPEDVVQSACRTFFRRAQGGQFQLPDAESLWRLLCTITITKIREQARFHLRKRRGVDQEQPLAPTSGDESSASIGFAAPGPTPAQAAEFADQLQQLLSSLDDEEKQIVELKLQDCTNDEVAERLGSSERTVRRVMKRIQERLTRILQSSES